MGESRHKTLLGLQLLKSAVTKKCIIQFRVLISQRFKNIYEVTPAKASFISWWGVDTSELHKLLLCRIRHLWESQFIPTTSTFFHVSPLVLVCICIFRSGSKVLRVEFLPVLTGNSGCTWNKEVEPYQISCCLENSI